MLSAPRRRRAANLACFVALSMVTPSFAFAADSPRTSPEATAAAHQHATRAHELYQQGAYHEAIAELEIALRLDPNGKDLVFNLGVVHEKLGNIEDALRYFGRYEQMDLDPQERAKADTYLRRLQGARKEVTKPVETVAPPPSHPPPPPPEKHHGRFDWVTAVTTAITGLGLGAGAVAGIIALQDRPAGSNQATDSLSYADIERAQQTAHRWAIASDFGFGVAAAGALTTLVLFFARTRDSASQKAGTGSPDPPQIVLSGGPLRGGGTFVVEARF